ncbi:hypothetical protein BST81_26580 [Leptolyngbya sp. 'hensonii']|uniref:hypothetical protein n=1 Tax=Leptolyngbya sp. 'hensonii' TaxID=1922337 RepID=UPI0009500361|nr:hypothetical protein [Leptolyngbya sp. 'hensonii']OLP15407.1 hypothetical protein BST81_26580 [Leptolyngbya sp. 'hensonii']
MSASTKASRSQVAIGSITVDGFILPDGSYRMSQTQVAECVGLTERNAREFLQSKALKSMLGDGYTPAISEIQSDEDQLRGSSRIRALPLDVVSAYWLWQSFRGNKKALALCMAMVLETLERRFDTAFGVTKSEQEYNELLTERMRLFQDLQRLGEAYATDDLIRQERDRFEKLLREYGIDPDVG